MRRGTCTTDCITTIAFIALGLATVGLAALTAHTVAQRRRELGIRLALGATPARVVSLVMVRVLRQLAVGLLLGVIGAVAWERLFATPGLLTGTANLVAVAVLVTVTTLGVAAWPARRAAQVDPLLTIRPD